MPMLGSGDKDGVHFFVFENLSKIFLYFGNVADILLTPRVVLLKDLVVHITTVDDLGIRVLVYCLNMGLGPASHADYGAFNLVVGS